MKGADRRRWESTVAGDKAADREAVAERSPRQTPDHRNTKSQRGRMRAASVLADAKPETHQDASSRGSWRGEKVHVLTQGDLFDESWREPTEGRQPAEGSPEGAPRSGSNSAEAVVVMRAGESRKERRAEGTTAKRPAGLWTAQEEPERQPRQVEEPPPAARTRIAQGMQTPQARRGEELRPPRGPRWSCARRNQ